MRGKAVARAGRDPLTLTLVAALALACAGACRGSSAQPTGAPVSATTLPVSSRGAIVSAGPVPVTLLSGQGPSIPVGPFAATSLAELNSLMTTALGGKPPTCGPGACWPGAHAPPASLLVAVRPTLTSCFEVAGLTSAVPSLRTLRIDIQMDNLCGAAVGGQAALATGLLLAVPIADLPYPGRLSVVVRVATTPGRYEPFGATEANLP
jgi:hypothetical protein